MSILLTYASSTAKTVEERDVVTVYNENKKRGEWRMALAESLIKAKMT